MTIKLEELRRLFGLLIGKLEEGGQYEISIVGDYYLKISPEMMYKVGLTPEPNIGSLLDDWSSLKQLLEDKDRPFTYVDFDRLAAMLMAISQDRNPMV